MWIIIVLFLLFIILFLLVRYSNIRNFLDALQGGRFGFYLKGLDAGFNISDIHLLWQAAVLAEIPRPKSIYGSVNELDKALHQISYGQRFLELNEGEPELQILGKLFNYRKKMEMSRPIHRIGLKSTHSISRGQILSIRGMGASVCTAEVVDNVIDHLIIALHVPTPKGYNWHNGALNILFSQKDDAEYFFQTRVINSFFEKRRFFLISHSDHVLKSQKRHFTRVPTKIKGKIFPVNNIDEIHPISENEYGQPCLIFNISENGAAMKIKDRSKKKQNYIMQFKIYDETVLILGKTQRSVYHVKKDETILHIQFLNLSENTRIIILSYVFNIGRFQSDIQEKEEKNRVEYKSHFPGTDDPKNKGSLSEKTQKENEERLELESVIPNDEP